MLAVVLLIAGVAAPPSLAGDQGAPGCKVFYLVEGDESVQLEAVDVPENEMKVLAGEDVITIVVPVDVGTSGDLVQGAEGKGLPLVRCQGGELRIMFQDADGNRREYPGVKMSDLYQYDIRVNVTGVELKEAFMIRGYETFEVDNGPVLDLFGGRFPLAEGDYSITTETRAHEEREAVEGTASLEYDRLLFASGRFPDGSEAPVIVDLGAGGTVIAKDFVPDGVEISEVVAMEYSAEGERQVSGQMEGAGGTVSGFLGNATLPSLQVGDIHFDEPVVRVLEEFPSFFGRDVGAILGLDLLSLGGVVSFSYGADGAAYLELAPEKRPGENFLELPFSMAANHIFIDGTINGEPATFLLDTGARGSIVSQSLADKARLLRVEGESMRLQGLDGQPFDAWSATAEKITLEGHGFESVKFLVADLAALKSMGIEQASGGVIGNDFLQQFERFEVDFEQRTIRFFD
jgi:hypothetical protein